jgi:hypothetical protein
LTTCDLNGKVRIIKQILNIVMSKELISKNKYIIIAIILIFGIGAGILGYLRNKKLTPPIASVSPAPIQSPATSPSPTPNPALTPPPEIWKTYTNSQLGFSIKYPQMVYGVYRCSPNKPFYVPLKAFEDNKNGIVYITEEYYYEAPYNGELNKYTGPCEKITYSLESLIKEREKYSNPFLARVFVIKSIKNDTELNKFIKDNYGSGCLIGSKSPWKPQEGVYEIEIRGEDWNKGSDLGTTTCPINYKYKVLYAPEKNNKVMSVGLGQECGFETDPASESHKCYDDEMIDGFKFE